MCRGENQQISDAMHALGIKTASDDPALHADLCRGMFDTSGKVDPFDDNSPIKKTAISDFPRQFFLVLRVVQLFRGLCSRMGVEYSSAEQWTPFAQALLSKEDSSDCNPGPPTAPAGKYYGI